MANTLLVSGSTHLTTNNSVLVQSSLQWRRKNFSKLSFTHSINLIKPIKTSIRYSNKPESGSGSCDPNHIVSGIEGIIKALREESEKLASELTDELENPDPDSPWPGLEEFIDADFESYKEQIYDPNLFDKLGLDEIEELFASAGLCGVTYDSTSKPVQADSVKETTTTSVLKLQVGLLGVAKLLQRELNWIAESSDTSHPDGLTYLLSETVITLLRHPDYCVSAYSSTDVKTNIQEIEKLFNQLSITQHVKFNEKTLVKPNNIRRQHPRDLISVALLNNDYIVITILVAAQGDYTLPNIQESKDLKDALQMLGTIPSSQIMDVKVHWTPQAENDTLSRRELLQDYPLLKRI